MDRRSISTLVVAWRKVSDRSTVLSRDKQDAVAFSLEPRLPRVFGIEGVANSTIDIVSDAYSLGAASERPWRHRPRELSTRVAAGIAVEETARVIKRSYDPAGLRWRRRGSSARVH